MNKKYKLNNNIKKKDIIQMKSKHKFKIFLKKLF